MNIFHSRIPNLLGSLLLVAGLSLVISSYTYAQEIETDPVILQDESSPSASESASPTPSPTQATTVTNVETRDINGEVVKASNNQITVETGSETVAIGLDSTIQITRDGKAVEPSAIQVGDQVKATIDTNNNQAISVEATSNQVAGMQQWLIPALVGLVLLIAILYYLMRRANRQKIKTTTTNM